MDFLSLVCQLIYRRLDRITFHCSSYLIKPYNGVLSGIMKASLNTNPSIIVHIRCPFWEEQGGHIVQCTLAPFVSLA